ncbi:DUF317 domain-containing protein [Kitasatospora sp. NPDC051984]|uniref:DUF317 domain-containing protein n=1 Tax=Kitasatospora sp. NPDC051984 TaxID=3364059 RepID=UPI0037C5F015
MPRYLAGAGSRTAPLARHALVFHWPRNYNRELDQTFVSSPDHRIRIASGQLDPGAWWRISAAREPLGKPQWMAAFSKDIPEEFVTAAIDSLIVPMPTTDWTGEKHPALKNGQFNGDAAMDALVAAGWRHMGGLGGVRRAESPDGLARAVLRRDADPLDLMGHCALAIEAGPEDAGEPYWQALFTADTPALVTDAFVRSLTDPAPLRRDGEWMDEHLLAHAGYTLTEDGLVPIPPAYTDKDLTLATAQTLSTLLAAADGVLSVEDVMAHLADRALPSTQTGPGPHTTWGQLPAEQQRLAAMLTLDLVMDSARYSHRLLGLSDTDATRHSRSLFAPDGAVSRPAWQRTTRGRIPNTPLDSLTFTNDDLYAAAGAITAHAIACTEPMGVSEGFYDQPIPSRSTPDGQDVYWDDLPQHLGKPAHDEIYRRFAAVSETAGGLFAPGMPRPAPLVAAAPAYLAGPGHTAASTPATPLLAAGWNFVDAPLGDIYLSPCGRIRTTATYAAGGVSWSTVYTDPSTGDPMWHFTADDRTPAEITAAVHEALADAQATTPADLRYPALSGGLEPLAEADWFMDNVPGHIIWTAPGGETASVSRTISASAIADGANPHWMVCGGDLQPGGQGWYIEMADRVPRPLLTAVAAALTSTEPVARLARQIPPEHRLHLDTVPLEWRTAAPPADRAAAARRRPLDGKATTPGPHPADPPRTPLPAPRRRTP